MPESLNLWNHEQGMVLLVLVLVDLGFTIDEVASGFWEND